MAAELERNVGSFVREHGLNGATLLIAVSGGADSVCLLHLLASLRDTLKIRLIAAHMDHGLRRASVSDAAYVARLSAELGIPLTVTRADVNGYRRTAGMSIEEAAREVRYRFLVEVAAANDTRYIVTGHTRSDQVETIMMHIIRGSGISGLVGLKPLTPWTIHGQDAVIVRPLLENDRSDTEGYCRAQGLKPVFDETNLSLSQLRNRIRIELLPLLKSYSRGIEKALLRLSRAAAAEKAFIDGEIDASWNCIVLGEDDVITMDKTAILSRPRAMQGHILRRMLERLLGEIRDIEMRHIEEIMSIMSRPAGRCLDLPYGLSFTVGYDRCWMGPVERIPSPYPCLSGEWPLKVPGMTAIPGWLIGASTIENTDGETGNALVALLDLDATGAELLVRGRRTGDRFMPLGLPGEKKLGEFMIDEKIPRHWRGDVPVVASPSGIVWVAGYRIDSRFMVTVNTRRILRLEFQQEKNKNLRAYCPAP